MAAAAILYFWNREFLFAVSFCRAKTHHYQISSKSVVPLWRYCIFSNFQDGHRRHLEFLKSKILLVIVVQSLKTHQYTKFRQNRSIGCEDITIFQFFKMAAVAILDFRNRKLLFAHGIWRADMHLCTKYFEIGHFFAEILRFFEFSRWPPSPSWIFEIAKFYWLLGSRGRRHISMPNFVKISQSVAKILRFFNFSRWRPCAILDLFGAHLDNSQWVLGGLYHSAKFRYDRCSSFYNMNISTFGILAGKSLFTPPKLGFLGNLIPINGLQYQQKPKKALPYVSPRHLSH